MNAAETLAEETFQFQIAEETWSWNPLENALGFYFDMDLHLSRISSPSSFWLDSETRCCLLGPLILNSQFPLISSSEFCYQPASSPCLSLPWVAC